MIINKLGDSEIKVSALTLGCMSLPMDLPVSSNIVHKALDSGINHLDTADLYHFGENEKMIGEILGEKRKNVILTTKIGNHFNKKTKKWFWDPSPTYLKQALQNSLKRLQTDYIDLLLMHGGTIDDPFDDVIDTLEQFKRFGQIRAYGISSIRPNVIKEYATKSNIDAIMMQYNLLDRRAEEWFSLLADKNISVLARGPLAKGLLANMPSERLLEKANNGYESYDQAELTETLEALYSMPFPVTTSAFQFIVRHPVVSSAVFGASSEEQVEQNLHYFTEGIITKSQIEFIHMITKKEKYTLHR